MQNGETIADLTRELTGQVKRFVIEERQLAKREVSERFSFLGKWSGSAAAGGLVAYSGLSVLLMSIGFLLGYAFQKAGLQPFLALFIGFMIIALLVIGTGGLLLWKGLQTIKSQSLAPERTIGVLHQITGKPPEPPKPADISLEKDNRSSAQIESSVRHIGREMAGTIDELRRRLSLKHLGGKVTTHVQSNPYRWSLAAMSSGLAAMYLIKRRFSRSAR